MLKKITKHRKIEIIEIASDNVQASFGCWINLIAFIWFCVDPESINGGIRSEFMQK